MTDTTQKMFDKFFGRRNDLDGRTTCLQIEVEEIVLDDSNLPYEQRREIQIRRRQAERNSQSK